jgi:site-specific DNA-methyltransferase (adenine-specific)
VIDIRNGTIPEALESFDDDSFDLIHADPPYYKVLAEAWDHQWQNREIYLGWLKSVLGEFQRVLKPNGSLYVWASAASAAAVEELCVRPSFDVISSIVWAKRGSMSMQNDKTALRGWLGMTERCIFAEHSNADGVAMHESGYGAKVAGLRTDVFEPLREYLDREREAAGVTNKEVNDALGNQMAGHYFGRSQWALPTAENYAKLQELFNGKRDGHLRREYGHLRREYGHLRREYEDLRREYGHLRREYEDLRREYEDLRRPFFAPLEGFTDVWKFASAESGPGRHPAEKPLDMMRHILGASTREGARVLDAFSGSGSMAAACVDLGRDVVAIEQDEALCEDIRRRVDRHLAAKSGSLHRVEMKPIGGPLFPPREGCKVKQ